MCGAGFRAQSLAGAGRAAGISLFSMYGKNWQGRKKLHTRLGVTPRAGYVISEYGKNWQGGKYQYTRPLVGPAAQPPQLPHDHQPLRELPIPGAEAHPVD